MFALAVSPLMNTEPPAGESPAVPAGSSPAEPNGYSFMSAGYWEAELFTAPGEGPVLVTNIAVPLSLFKGPTNLGLQIRLDHKGLPGPVVGLLKVPARVPSPPSLPFPLTTLTPAGSIILQGGTPYWLSAFMTAGEVLWARGSHADTFWAASTDQGASWTARLDDRTLSHLHETVPATDVRGDRRDESRASQARRRSIELLR